MSDRKSPLEHLRRMSGRERLVYLWDYYRWAAVAVLAAGFLLFTAGRILWEGQRPCRLRVCAVLNDRQTSCAAWFEEFGRELSADGRPGALDLNEDQIFDYKNTYIRVMEAEVMTTIASGRMDVAVCGEDLFSYLLSRNACLPVDTLLPDCPDRWELGRAGVTTQPDGSLNWAEGVDGYFALNLAGTAFDHRYNDGTDQPLYAVVIANTEHTADAVRLLYQLIKE